MAKCYVRQLNTVINDDSLPVMETMQQFTLDAITLSGNSSMTDNQKNILNHFFYEVGAIDNNALWGKMKCILLPMICGDVVAKSMVDYKNSVVVSPANADKLSFDTHHGLVASGYNSTLVRNGTFNGSNFNITMMSVEMTDGVPVSENTTNCIMVDSGSSSDRTIMNIKKADENSLFRATDLLAPMSTNSFSGNNVYDVAAVTSKAASGNIRAISSQNEIVLHGDATPAQITARGAEKTYTNAIMRFGVTAGVRSYGLVLVSEALTDDELAKVMEAAKQLKLAFVA